MAEYAAELLAHETTQSAWSRRQGGCMKRHTLAAARTFAVIMTKSTTGVDVVFSTCSTRSEANALVANLANVGLAARVEHARATDVAGSERRSP
jgi:hypothetical protein